MASTPPQISPGDEVSRFTEVQSMDECLHVAWDDGYQSDFHYLWLRDNCRCKQCGERAIGQKLSLLVDVPADVEPLSKEISAHGALVLRWAPDGHVSHYEPEWLREHCYSDMARDARCHRPRLWDNTLQRSLPETTWKRSFHDDAGQHELLALIRDYGFALVHGVPTNRDDFERMAGHIGFLRETNYGRIGDLVSKEVVRTLSNSKHAIPLHTDEGYRHANPGMLAFLCLSTSEDGQGATLLADGFNLAEQLRRDSPQSFDLLSRIPINSRRYWADEMDLRSATPIISVDFQGRVQGVRYNERSAAPLDVPSDLIKPVYAALREWLTLSSAPVNRVSVLLQPGDFVVFDNQRVLHGRETFTGNRHLIYCQMDLDELHSRTRVLEARLGLLPSGLTMHRGT